MKIVTDKSTTLRLPMHINTDSLSEPQNSISSMENNQMHSGTEPETQGLALEHSEILEDIVQIRGMAEEINQSLTETQWRQRLDAPASSIARNSRTEQTENGAEMDGGQYPPTQITQGGNRIWQLHGTQWRR